MRLPFQAWFNKPGSDKPVEADFRSVDDAMEWLELMTHKHYPFGGEDAGVFEIKHEDVTQYELSMASVQARRRIEQS